MENYKIGQNKQNTKAMISTLNDTPHKFNIGDWITDGYLHCKISDVLDDRYIVDTNFAKRSAISFKRENNYHLWSIADAKDGDVLAYPDGSITLFRKRVENLYMVHILWVDGHIELNNSCAVFNANPATKEQRELFFRKMRESDYEWDSEKKILKEIEYPLPSFDEAQGTPIIKIDKKKRYVPNEVFRFYVELDFGLPEITVFTKPFPEANSIEEYESREKYVQEKYFTKECINKIKEILIKKIQENDNPFHITCTDRDSGYDVTEDELFKIN